MMRVGHFYCPVCEQERAMMTVQHAAEVVGVTVRTIYRWIEQQKVHAVPVASGASVRSR
ncbi:MAG TPA: helix-turn-helix domain-containing protein [Blastocatellia bacterium]|nr:helix-turn-helix domain-containing protein [Blastocatellia bacterium]